MLALFVGMLCILAAAKFVAIIAFIAGYTMPGAPVWFKIALSVVMVFNVLSLVGLADNIILGIEDQRLGVETITLALLFLICETSMWALLISYSIVEFRKGKKQKIVDGKDRNGEGD